MLKSARQEAGISLETAALSLGVSPKTLYNYENFITDVPPRVIKEMSVLYNQHRKFRNRYCAEICPIGRDDALRAKERDVAVSALTLLRKYREADSAIKEKFVDICEDGIIEEHEVPVLREVCNKLLPLDEAIQSVKLLAETHLPEVFYKNRKPAQAVAEERVTYKEKTAFAMAAR